MALDTRGDAASPNAPAKALYEVGEMPPLGHVPAQMYAWTIRRDRQASPIRLSRSRSSIALRPTATRFWSW